MFSFFNIVLVIHSEKNFPHRKNGKYNEQSTTFILGKTMDENNDNGKTEFQFESEEHCFNTCNITQPEWCRNIEVGLS